MKLRFWQKTYLLSLSLFLLALYGGIIFIGWQNWNQMLNSEIEKARSEQHFIAQNVAKDISATNQDSEVLPEALFKSYGNYYAQDGLLSQFIYDGEVLFSNFPIFDDIGSLMPKEPGEQLWTTKQIDEDLHVIISSHIANDQQSVVLVCARSLSEMVNTWGDMKNSLLVGSFAVSVLLALSLYFVLRDLSKPLEKLAGNANRFAQGDLNQRAEVKGHDEIQDLALGFNAMADTAVENIDEIKQVAEKNARMAADLSHEIRTPLTAIKGYAEYMRIAELTEDEQSSSLDYIIDESARLQKISQRMLQLASLDHASIELTPIKLRDIVQRAALSVQADIKKASLHLEIDPIPDVRIACDEILMESLLINLLDNAIKACMAYPSGERIQLRTTLVDKLVIIEIIDSGQGMNADELLHLGEPFYRADTSRSRKSGGTGLGVSLCYKIAALHKADLRYSSAPGKGTIATLLFNSC